MTGEEEISEEKVPAAQRNRQKDSLMLATMLRSINSQVRHCRFPVQRLLRNLIRFNLRIFKALSLP